MKSNISNESSHQIDTRKLSENDFKKLRQLSQYLKQSMSANNIEVNCYNDDDISTMELYLREAKSIHIDRRSLQISNYITLFEKILLARKAFYLLNVSDMQACYEDLSIFARSFNNKVFELFLLDDKSWSIQFELNMLKDKLQYLLSWNELIIPFEYECNDISNITRTKFTITDSGYDERLENLLFKLKHGTYIAEVLSTKHVIEKLKNLIVASKLVYDIKFSIRLDKILDAVNFLNGITTEQIKDFPCLQSFSIKISEYLERIDPLPILKRELSIGFASGDVGVLNMNSPNEVGLESAINFYNLIVEFSSLISSSSKFLFDTAKLVSNLRKFQKNRDWKGIKSIHIQLESIGADTNELTMVCHQEISRSLKELFIHEKILYLKDCIIEDELNLRLSNDTSIYHIEMKSGCVNNLDTLMKCLTSIEHSQHVKLGPILHPLLDVAKSILAYRKSISIRDYLNAQMHFDQAHIDFSLLKNVISQVDTFISQVSGSLDQYYHKMLIPIFDCIERERQALVSFQTFNYFEKRLRTYLEDYCIEYLEIGQMKPYELDVSLFTSILDSRNSLEYNLGDNANKRLDSLFITAEFMMNLRLAVLHDEWEVVLQHLDQSTSMINEFTPMRTQLEITSFFHEIENKWLVNHFKSTLLMNKLDTSNDLINPKVSYSQLLLCIDEAKYLCRSTEAKLLLESTKVLITIRKLIYKIATEDLHIHNWMEIFDLCDRLMNPKTIVKSLHPIVWSEMKFIKRCCEDFLYCNNLCEMLSKGRPFGTIGRLHLCSSLNFQDLYNLISLVSTSHRASILFSESQLIGSIRLALVTYTRNKDRRLLIKTLESKLSQSRFIELSNDDKKSLLNLQEELASYHLELKYHRLIQLIEEDLLEAKEVYELRIHLMNAKDIFPLTNLKVDISHKFQLNSSLKDYNLQLEHIKFHFQVFLMIKRYREAINTSNIKVLNKIKQEKKYFDLASEELEMVSYEYDYILNECQHLNAMNILLEGLDETNQVYNKSKDEFERKSLIIEEYNLNSVYIFQLVFCIKCLYQMRLAITCNSKESVKEIYNVFTNHEDFPYFPEFFVLEIKDGLPRLMNQLYIQGVQKALNSGMLWLENQLIKLESIHTNTLEAYISNFHLLLYPSEEAKLWFEAASMMFSIRVLELRGDWKGVSECLNTETLKYLTSIRDYLNPEIEVAFQFVHLMNKESQFQLCLEYLKEYLMDNVFDMIGCLDDQDNHKIGYQEDQSLYEKFNEIYLISYEFKTGGRDLSPRCRNILKNIEIFDVIIKHIAKGQWSCIATILKDKAINRRLQLVDLIYDLFDGILKLRSLFIEMILFFQREDVSLTKQDNSTNLLSFITSLLDLKSRCFGDEEMRSNELTKLIPKVEFIAQRVNMISFIPSVNAKEEDARLLDVLNVEVIRYIKAIDFSILTQRVLRLLNKAMRSKNTLNLREAISIAIRLIDDHQLSTSLPVLMVLNKAYLLLQQYEKDEQELEGLLNSFDLEAINALIYRLNDNGLRFQSSKLNQLKERATCLATFEEQIEVIKLSTKCLSIYEDQRVYKLAEEFQLTNHPIAHKAKLLLSFVKYQEVTKSTNAKDLVFLCKFVLYWQDKNTLGLADLVTPLRQAFLSLPCSQMNYHINKYINMSLEPPLTDLPNQLHEIAKAVYKHCVIPLIRATNPHLRAHIMIMIVKLGFQQVILRDELISQMIIHLLPDNNSDEFSRNIMWKALALVLYNFPPSELFENYLENFLYQQSHNTQLQVITWQCIRWMHQSIIRHGYDNVIVSTPIADIAWYQRWFENLSNPSIISEQLSFDSRVSYVYSNIQSKDIRNSLENWKDRFSKFSYPIHKNNQSIELESLDLGALEVLLWHNINEDYLDKQVLCDIFDMQIFRFLLLGVELDETYWMCALHQWQDFSAWSYNDSESEIITLIEEMKQSIQIPWKLYSNEYLKPQNYSWKEFSMRLNSLWKCVMEVSRSKGDTFDRIALFSWEVYRILILSGIDIFINYYLQRRAIKDFHAYL